MILLVSATVFVSLFTSHSLTKSIRRLLFGMKQVSEGDLDVVVPPSGQDEVGQLTSGFNQMTGEIRRLLKETAGKARMEEELTDKLRKAGR